MKPIGLVLVTVLVIFVCGSGGYEPKKYGCLQYPSICVPPEDCSDDGLTGNCRVPYPEKKWRTRSEGGYYLNPKDFRDTGAGLEHEKNWKREYYVTNSDLNALLLALNSASNGVELAGFDSEKNHQYVVPTNSDRSHQEFRRSPVMSETGNVRVERMKGLVKETTEILAQRGVRLADFSDEEIIMLARYLAKILLAQDAEGHSMATENRKISDVDKQDSIEYLLSQKSAKKQDHGQVKNILAVQEQPAEMYDLTDAIKEEPQVRDTPPDPDTSNGASDSPVNSEKGRKKKAKSDTLYIVVIVVGATVLLIILVTIISCLVHAYRAKKQDNKKFIGSVTSDETQPFGDDYQELCRQHYASKNSDVAENHKEILESGIQDPLITRAYPLNKPNDVESKQSESGIAQSRPNVTRNSSVSSVSWSEEPVTANLDITTGHAVLSYMEDHLTNKNRLDKEWEEICGYEADSITTAAAITPQNSRKNRSVVALPYDHNRIKLKEESNHLQSDYINASAIIDNDPKRPLYIAAQGPLPSTIPDFWQMMWEQGCVAIVMLTPLVEEGVNQCARYWPDEGSCTYHNFEIHLVSEHIWCEDFLVRSLYLKHLESGETRTVTQFHFLSWPKDRVPSTPKPLLELRRKVTKCYKGHNSPVLVHCSDGVGRTGTYILLDLAIDRMLKGAKEIDIAATLEHIRDQRVGMVANKEQFEFALTAVAEEVNAILKSLLH